MTEIIKGLFLGAKSDSLNENFIKNNKITAILNCASEIKIEKHLTEQYMHINALDEKDFKLN